MSFLLNNYKALKLAYYRYHDVKNNSDYLKWHFNDYKKLLKFYNAYKGEDCFIIGNGPSLNKMDLSGLKGHHVFGLNKIYLILEKQNIDFSFIVAVNPLVIEQSKEVYENMNVPIFVSESASRGCFGNISHIHKIKANGGFDFSTSFLDGISEGYTVTYVAIQLAYIMGFKRIFLIGVDHNFQQSGNPNSEQVMTTDDANHFHPEYFKGQKWHLADLEGNEISYRIAKRKLLGAGREIYNATLGGKLEIFSRMTYEEALRIAKDEKSLLNQY